MLKEEKIYEFLTPSIIITMFENVHLSSFVVREVSIQLKQQRIAIKKKINEITIRYIQSSVFNEQIYTGPYVLSGAVPLIILRRVSIYIYVVSKLFVFSLYIFF